MRAPIRKGLSGRKVSAWIRNNPVVIVLVVLFVLFSTLYPERFLTSMNLSAILRQFVRLMLFALGPSLVIITGSIDLSYVGTWMLGGVLVWLAFPILGLYSIAIYPLLGAFTGLLVGSIQVKTKIPSFVLTLSLLVSYWGLTAWLAGGRPRVVRGFEFITAPLVPYIPSAFLWAIPLILLTVVLAKGSAFGTYLYAIGSNEEGAKLAGIRVDRYKVLGFVMSGLLTGVGLIVLFPFLGGSSPTELKLGNIVDPLVAIVLGGTPLVGGAGGPHYTIFGALAYAVVYRGLYLALLHPQTVQLLLGLVIIGAILVSSRGLKGVIIT